jgi:multidrug efflux pump subunit AcrB
MAPDRLQHHEQFASIRVDFSLAPGVTLEQATNAIEQAMASIMLPSGIVAYSYVCVNERRSAWAAPAAIVARPAVASAVSRSRVVYVMNRI